MSDNDQIIRALVKACIERNDKCPDYGGRGKKASDMALNFFIGAANLAKAQGNENLFNRLQSIAVFEISIRGIEAIYDRARENENV